MSIGENIKKLRKNKGLSQKQLAEILNLSEITIRRYEKCSNIPTIETINKIADALGMPLSELLGNSVKTNDIGIKINELLEVNISNNTGAEKNISEMTINELYDLIYELRNKISSLEDLNATLIENMEKIKKLVNIKY